MLDSLQAKARAASADGALEDLQREMRERAVAYVHEPPSLGLPAAGRTHEWHLDPSVEVPEDIRDADGRLVVSAGARVNPLMHMRLTRELVFVDGKDPDQVAWLRAWLLDDRPRKVILVGGSPVELSESLQIPLWFDQVGEVTQALSVTEVPAVVTQDEHRLLVRVFGPEDAP